MNYCALDDAFQMIGGAPSPGCATDYATKEARREERRKARRCKGPAATYLDIQDPDRPAGIKLPDIPPMNSSTGMREHTPVMAPQGSIEPFALPMSDSNGGDGYENNHTSAHSKTDQLSAHAIHFDADPLGNYMVEEQRAKVMTVPTVEPSVTESMGSKKRYFGASPDDDAFADYIPDQKNYQLQPDFLTAFEQAGVARAGSTAALPNPSVNMYWKPLTTAGAQTSFMEHLPPPGGKYYKEPNESISTKEMMKKIDKIFARLDDMNMSSPENTTSELLMFISSGIFVLFLMDLLVKKGSTLRF